MTQQPRGYLHGHHDSVLRSHRWRTAENSAAYLLSHLTQSDHMLDVGCGAGTITLGLGGYVLAGSVIAIDAADGVIAEARAEALRQRRTNVSFEVGDVYRLRFADQTFDVVHAHQVVQHLGDPVRALREMHRVCRSGGMVAVREVDFGGMFWSPEDPGLDQWRQLYTTVARAVGGEPNAGRSLLQWSQEAGFKEVELSASMWCYSSVDERSWWGELWAERLTDSSFDQQAIELGLASPDGLNRLSVAWRRWASSSDACFFAPHGEVPCTR